MACCEELVPKPEDIEESISIISRQLKSLRRLLKLSRSYHAMDRSAMVSVPANGICVGAQDLPFGDKVE